MNVEPFAVRFATKYYHQPLQHKIRYCGVVILLAAIGATADVSVATWILVMLGSFAAKRMGHQAFEVCQQRQSLPTGAHESRTVCNHGRWQNVLLGWQVYEAPEHLLINLFSAPPLEWFALLLRARLMDAEFQEQIWSRVEDVRKIRIKQPACDSRLPLPSVNLP